LYTAGQERPKFDFLIVSREEKLSFQPDQAGGNFFGVTAKLFAEKNSLKEDFLLHSVISII